MWRIAILLALATAACSAPGEPVRLAEVRLAVEKSYYLEEGARTRVLVARPGDEPIVDEELEEFQITRPHRLVPGTYELRVLEFSCPEEGCADTRPTPADWELVCTREFRLRAEEKVDVFAQVRTGPQGRECALAVGEDARFTQPSPAAARSSADAEGELVLSIEHTVAFIEGGFLRLRVIGRDGRAVHDGVQHVHIPTPEDPLQELRVSLRPGRYRFELSNLGCGPEGCGETIDVDSVTWNVHCARAFHVGPGQTVRREIVTDLSHCQVTEHG